MSFDFHRPARAAALMLVAGVLAAAHCPPKPSPTPTPPSPATSGCPAVPGGAPTTTASFTIASTRQLRRTHSFISPCTPAPRPPTASWTSTPPAGLVRVGSYEDDCGTFKDELSVHVVLDLSPVVAAVAALPPKANGACRILSASLVLNKMSEKQSIALNPGEFPFCVGQVRRATNGDWLTIPLEDSWTNQFLGATAVPLDTLTPVLPIHVPPRAGEPVPAPSWRVNELFLRADLLDAMRLWVERGTPNDGIVLSPQDALGTLAGAKVAGSQNAWCMWDMRFDDISSVVTIDTSP